MSWRIRLQPTYAADILRVLPPPVKRSIRAALRELLKDPTGTTTGLDVKALLASEPGPPAYRLRVGDWRIAFEIRAREIRVIRIFHRREGYAWLERLG